MILRNLIRQVLLVSCALAFGCTGNSGDIETRADDSPKIVNIINFVRLLEPRDPEITEEVLFQTVVKQVEILRKYNLTGTFLLQYDALMDPRYQKLLKSLPEDSFEIGGWWEIPQPLVEKAGMKWRGRYPWDWRANVGFSTGYTQAERKKLVDVYMNDFKQIFGYYPKSVGSWFIDAFSLNYMYEKYHIMASTNCKDQVGTDGYTVWGGYWNQAYYPSRKNAYMPAQHEENQIPVPVFRMLGSDPVRQYDNGLGTGHQGVVTLEPVYPFGGGDSTWVNWYFNTFVNDPSLGFNYVQAGQENSFTWDAMEKGYELQIPLIARLYEEKKIRVETLSESAAWFREKYAVTPATSFSVSRDIGESNRKTIWYNSRFYRVNILWEDGKMKFRDIHLFDENLASNYLDQVATSNECTFFTLPFVDGYLWSARDSIAGLRLNATINGNEISLEGGDPVFEKEGPEIIKVRWPLTTAPGTFIIELDEDKLMMRLEGGEALDWHLDLTTAHAKLPFETIDSSYVQCRSERVDYTIRATDGRFSMTEGAVFRLSPVSNRIVLNLSTQ